MSLGEEIVGFVESRKDDGSFTKVLCLHAVGKHKLPLKKDGGRDFEGERGLGGACQHERRGVDNGTHDAKSNTNDHT